MTASEMKKIAIKACIFTFISMSLIIHRSVTKHIMITDAAGAQIDRSKSDSSYTLLVDAEVPAGKEDTLIIPLPKDVGSDNIILEDRYMEHGLSIYIDSHEAGFYMDNPIVTDISSIVSSVCVNRNDTGSVCLDFTLDGLYANESTLTDISTIEVKFFDPSEKYDKVVVVDADMSGAEDAALELALLLKELADGDAKDNVRFYFTGVAGAEADNEQREALISDLKADLFLELSVGYTSQGEAEGISSYYNDGFFLQRLSNARFADIMLKNCAGRGVGGAIGVYADPEDKALVDCKVPASRLEFVYKAGNGAVGLSDRNSLKRMAEGIYNGIILSLEDME